MHDKNGFLVCLQQSKGGRHKTHNSIICVLSESEHFSSSLHARRLWAYKVLCGRWNLEDVKWAPDLDGCVCYRDTTKALRGIEGHDQPVHFWLEEPTQPAEAVSSYRCEWALWLAKQLEGLLSSFDICENLRVQAGIRLLMQPRWIPQVLKVQTLSIVACNADRTLPIGVL